MKSRKPILDMVTYYDKDKIHKFIHNMEFSKPYSLDGISEAEKEYVIYLCETQTGARGYYIETNGVSTDRATQTKIKKICYCREGFCLICKKI